VDASIPRRRRFGDIDAARENGFHDGAEHLAADADGRDAARAISHRPPLALEPIVAQKNDQRNAG
jgi:hypothetical protein